MKSCHCIKTLLLRTKGHLYTILSLSWWELWLNYQYNTRIIILNIMIKYRNKKTPPTNLFHLTVILNSLLYSFCCICWLFKFGIQIKRMGECGNTTIEELEWYKNILYSLREWVVLLFIFNFANYEWLRKVLHPHINA